MNRGDADIDVDTVDPRSVTVVLPTFNEVGNLESVVTGIRAHGYRVIVVDDASTDGTGELADGLAAADAAVTVVHRPSKAGLGSAYAVGFADALEAGARVVCGMDADLQHDPAAVPNLVSAIEGGADLAIGSRFVPGGHIEGWSLWRRGLSRSGNRYARMMLGVPVRDLTSGFRALRVESLTSIDPASCRAHGYGFLIEVALRAHRSGLRITEVPIVFRRRHSGESKLDGRIVREAMWLVTVWGIARIVRLGPAR